MDFSAMPNDIIMNIIRMADGGLNTHKSKMASVLSVIKKGKRMADDYIETYEDDFDMVLSAITDPETYYDQWGYAFWTHIEINQ
jgi:hypothetical protein